MGNTRFFVLLLLTAGIVPGQQVKVIRELRHDTSPSARTLAASQTSISVGVSEEPDETLRESAEDDAVPVKDEALQVEPGKTLSVNLGLNILGLGIGFTGPQGTFKLPYAPPDTNAAVGASQVVESVNISWAVFDKTTGATLLGPVSIQSLFSGLSADCTAAFLADPIVLYDKLAQRWMIKIVTLQDPYYTCVAVSTSSDATGTYNRYEFSLLDEGNLTGQKMGLWPDGYYFAQSTYTTESTYTGPEACVMDRSQMLIGAPATMQCIQLADKNIHGMIPSDLDGPAPPPGSPNYFLIQGPAHSNQLYLYKFHVDFTTPANTTFTGPVAINVAKFTPATPDGVVAVPQLNTTELLDDNGSDLMMRLSYRNFASAVPAYESLLVNQSVRAGSGGSSVGVRWYEIRSPGTTPTVHQQGTFAPDSTYRWMASLAQDKMGDIALGYSVSSASMYPGIRMTGRLPSDKLNTMESEITLYNGSGSQTGGGRWGDYSSMSVDPVDDCTMWYATEYMAGTANVDWATRLFSFKFPSCH